MLSRWSKGDHFKKNNLNFKVLNFRLNARIFKGKLGLFSASFEGQRVVESLYVHHSRALTVQLKEKGHVTGLCTQVRDDPVLFLGS